MRRPGVLAATVAGLIVLTLGGLLALANRHERGPALAALDEISADGRTLLLSASSCKGKPEADVVSQGPDTVEVRVVSDIQTGDGPGCADLVNVRLAEPLGDRRVVDVSSGEALDTLPAMLLAAQLRWAQGAVSDYTMTLVRHCFCGAAGAFQVVVRNDRVVSVAGLEPQTRAVPDAAQPRLGVTDLLTMAADPKWEAVEADFDPQLGYPTVLKLDEYLAARDDEVDYFIESFTPDSA